MNLNNSVKGNVYPIIELSLKENSNLEIILSVTSLEDVNIANSIYAKVLKDANLKIHTISMGGELSRSRMDIDLVGDGSGFYLDGVYFGEDSQIHDSRVFVNHLGKNTNSNMITKGVLGDRSSSIFTGTIHIAEGAIKRAEQNSYIDPKALDKRIHDRSQYHMAESTIQGANIFGDIFGMEGPTWNSSKPAKPVEKPDFDKMYDTYTDF